MASGYGLIPDEWQHTVLRAWLGYRPDGKWTTRRAGLAVPRQNGKNGILEIRELFGMIALGERFLHTAHEVKTARKAFQRILSFFENERKYPELAGLVATGGIRKANGQEAIVLKNGGSVEFAARSKSSGRGFSVDVLVMDEAQELVDDAYEALLPTISASRNPQQIMTGTPPGPTQNGEVFTRLREAGLLGVEPFLSWLEWSVTGREVDLDDVANWAATNPALGIRLSLEFTAGERASFSDEGFARERLGMWDGVASQEVIDMALWHGLKDDDSRRGEKVAFAVDVTPDRGFASIAVASKRADDVWHLEVVQNERGTDWIVDRIVELSAKWKPVGVALDAAGPAGSLIADLTKRGVAPTVVTARDMGQACGAFYDAAQNHLLRHRNQPSLNAALTAARQRTLGDAWAWHRKDSNADISPLVAVTLAMNEYARQEIKPKRTGKVW